MKCLEINLIKYAQRLHTENYKIKGLIKCINTNMSLYYVLFYSSSQILHFLRIYKSSSKSVGAIFPIACAHFMSLCYILVILAIF